MLLFPFCVSMTVFFVPCVLFRFCRKSKDSFSPFQQGVHSLPELEKFPFSSSYLKRSKVFKTTFLSTYIFWKFHRKYYLLYTPSEQFRRFSLNYTIWAYLREINIKKFWYFFGDSKMTRLTQVYPSFEKSLEERDGEFKNI